MISKTRLACNLATGWHSACARARCDRAPGVFGTFERGRPSADGQAVSSRFRFRVRKLEERIRKFFRDRATVTVTVTASGRPGIYY
jgi:hypothetical protein